jgi:hypothetical protein
MPARAHHHHHRSSTAGAAQQRRRGTTMLPASRASCTRSSHLRTWQPLPPCHTVAVCFHTRRGTQPPPQQPALQRAAAADDARTTARPRIAFPRPVPPAARAASVTAQLFAERPLLTIETVHTSRGTVGIGELPAITRPGTAASSAGGPRSRGGSPGRVSGGKQESRNKKHTARHCTCAHCWLVCSPRPCRARARWALRPLSIRARGAMQHIAVVVRPRLALRARTSAAQAGRQHDARHLARRRPGGHHGSHNRT